MTASPGERGVTTPKEPARQLDRQFAHGIAWTGISRFGSQLLSWSTFLITARILSPGDFGIVAAATSVVGLVSLVAEFGLGTAIVSKREVEAEEMRQLAGLAAGLGILAWLVCIALSWPATRALRVPELLHVMPLIGLTIGLTTLNAVPTALMRRQLAFRRLATFEVIRSLVGAATVLAGALSGWGFWALLAGDLAANVAMTLMLFAGTRLTLHRPRRSRLAGSLQLSRDLLVNRVAWYTYSNADFAIVSRRLGKVALGDYSMAWTLINLPSEKVATLLFAVTPSIFARVRDDLPEFRRYVRLLFESMALLLVPASAGVALVASDAVAVILGEQWRRAVPLIQALSLFAVVKSIGPLSAQILIARGRAAAARRQAMWGLAVLPPGFLLASAYGAVAVALVWTIVYPVLVLFQIREAASEIGLTMRELAEWLRPMAAGAIAMTFTVLLVQRALRDPPGGAALRLGVCIAVGALTYGAVISLLARPRVNAAIDFVRRRRA